MLDRRCKQSDIVMFLSQVASALHYLHMNHIVHGDLRAEYVNVVAPDKVLETILSLTVINIRFLLKKKIKNRFAVLSLE